MTSGCAQTVVQSTPAPQPVTQVVQQNVARQLVIVPGIVSPPDIVPSVVEQTTQNRLEQVVRPGQTVLQPVGPPGPQGVPGPTGATGPQGVPGIGATHFARFEDSVAVAGARTYVLSPPYNAGTSRLDVNGLTQPPSAYSISLDGSQLTVPADLIWVGATLFFEYSY